MIESNLSHDIWTKNYVLRARVVSVNRKDWTEENKVS